MQKYRRLSGWLAALSVFATVVAVVPALAATPKINPDAALEYTVKKGDTLWDISEYYLQDPWLWPELWFANPQVENPHLIYPGDILHLIWVEGKPRLQRKVGGLERISPRVRTAALETAIPTIPLDAIRAFLQGPRVISKDEYEKAPYVVAFADQHLMGADELETFVKRADPAEGYRYDLIRIGKKYKDPESGRTLGYEGIPLGDAEIREFGEVSRAYITEVKREVLKGDRLMPRIGDGLTADFQPRAPQQNIEGQIIAAYDALTQIGQYQIVTLNRGASHGLEPGHVLSISQRGELVDDPERLWGKVRLPSLHSGELMVFKVEDELSYALIMRATRPIHVLDKVGNPVPTS